MRPMIGEVALMPLRFHFGLSARRKAGVGVGREFLHGLIVAAATVASSAAISKPAVRIVWTDHVNRCRLFPARNRLGGLCLTDTLVPLTAPAPASTLRHG
jgi:hypothetical protein